MHLIPLAIFAATAAIAVNGARLLTSHLVTPGILHKCPNPQRHQSPRKAESEKPTVRSSTASTNMATDAPTFATAKPAIPAVDVVAISPMPSSTNSKPVSSPPYAAQVIGSPVAPIYGAKKGY
ncbi:hypothetical protein DL89DRAFT_265492 [Linderina pennispora]|uniref:Uncharacterized protein n=1 Tax=Linderina pennispora TaxID=61395 RepID=A0A1Y1WE88_9FUNG|nr:uncharacterized protein DL89DRAFT_265492 [Linderina pennispora]ORX71782.1 hypothetical protein DL89DRAFT_265492 [Linderina pennispora]